MSEAARKVHFAAQENACERLFKTPEEVKARQTEAAELLRSAGTQFGLDLSQSRSLLTDPQTLATLSGHARILKALRGK